MSQNNRPVTNVDYVPSSTADADTTSNSSGKTRLCRRDPWKPMPMHTFPPAMRDAIEATADVKDIDPALVALPMLAVCSASIGNSCQLQLRRDYRVPAVLWPISVADSGDGKSPGMDAATRPLVLAQTHLHQQQQKAQADHAQAVKEWKSLPKSERGDEPAAPDAMMHLYTTDCTAEAAVMLLAKSPRGLLCAPDEFAGLVSSFNSYKSRGSDLEFWLAVHGARAAKVDRKTATPPCIFVPRAFVALTGTIQPPTLQKALGGNMIGNGFAARLLLARPPGRQRRWRDDDVPLRIVDAYAEVVMRLRQLPCNEEPKAIKPTSAALRRWREWWAACESARANETHPSVRAMLPKVCDAAARIALVFHSVAVVTAAPGIMEEQLDESSMAAGIELADWFAYEGRRVYGLLDNDAGTDAEHRLYDWIVRRGGTATVREVCRNLREYRDTEAAENALRGLVEAGDGFWRDELPGPTGGRPVRRFIVALAEIPESADTTSKTLTDLAVVSSSTESDAA